MPESPIKVLIVDDHPMVRAAIRNLLSTASDILVVEEGENGRQAIELATQAQPDLVLLDIELPDLRGDAVARCLRDTQPGIKVLAVTSYSDREYLISMLENGAAGYITKDEAPARLLEAIRSIVYAGRSWFSPLVTRDRRLSPPEEQTLTEQEVRVLRQLLLGKSEKEIGEALGLEEERVAKFLRLLMIKFNVETTASLSLIAERILGPSS
ncbi:MAG: response regulator [Bacteroidota bacterium]